MMKEDSEKEVAENRYFVEFPGVQRGADVDQEGEVNAGAVAPVQLAQALMESLSEKKGVSCKWGWKWSKKNKNKKFKGVQVEVVAEQSASDKQKLLTKIAFSLLAYLETKEWDGV